MAEDDAALVAAEREVAIIRDRLNASKRASVSLRYAVQQWDKWYADPEQENTTPTTSDSPPPPPPP